jgi:transcriptional regulator with XRE-family HTH domain
MDEVFGITPEELKEALADLDTRQAAWDLQQLRKKQGLTQQAVAESMHDAQNRVSQIEKGGVERVRLNTLRRYAQALGGTLTVEISIGENKYQVA